MDSTTLEPQQNTNETPQVVSEPMQATEPRKVRGYFNSQNARELQRRGCEAKKLRAEARRIAVEQASLQLSPEELYRQTELARTRKEIDACQKAMESSRNGPARDYKALSDALWRLREIERVLAGRPLPGNYRPVREKVKRAAAGAAGPLDAETE